MAKLRVERARNGPGSVRDAEIRSSNQSGLVLRVRFNWHKLPAARVHPNHLARTNRWLSSKP